MNRLKPSFLKSRGREKEGPPSGALRGMGRSGRKGLSDTSPLKEEEVVPVTEPASSGSFFPPESNTQPDDDSETPSSESSAATDEKEQSIVDMFDKIESFNDQEAKEGVRRLEQVGRIKGRRKTQATPRRFFRSRAKGDQPEEEEEPQYEAAVSQSAGFAQFVLEVAKPPPGKQEVKEEPVPEEDSEEEDIVPPEEPMVEIDTEEEVSVATDAPVVEINVSSDGPQQVSPLHTKIRKPPVQKSDPVSMEAEVLALLGKKKQADAAKKDDEEAEQASEYARFPTDQDREMEDLLRMPACLYDASADDDEDLLPSMEDEVRLVLGIDKDGSKRPEIAKPTTKVSRRGSVAGVYSRPAKKVEPVALLQRSHSEQDLTKSDSDNEAKKKKHKKKATKSKPHKSEKKKKRRDEATPPTSPAREMKDKASPPRIPKRTPSSSSKKDRTPSNSGREKPRTEKPKTEVISWQRSPSQHASPRRPVVSSRRASMSGAVGSPRRVSGTGGNHRMRRRMSATHVSSSPKGDAGYVSKELAMALGSVSPRASPKKDHDKKANNLATGLAMAPNLSDEPVPVTIEEESVVPDVAETLNDLENILAVAKDSRSGSEDLSLDVSVDHAASTIEDDQHYEPGPETSTDDPLPVADEEEAESPVAIENEPDDAPSMEPEEDPAKLPEEDLIGESSMEELDDLLPGPIVTNPSEDTNDASEVAESLATPDDDAAITADALESPSRHMPNLEVEEVPFESFTTTLMENAEKSLRNISFSLSELDHYEEGSMLSPQQEEDGSPDAQYERLCNEIRNKEQRLAEAKTLVSQLDCDLTILKHRLEDLERDHPEVVVPDED